MSGIRMGSPRPFSARKIVIILSVAALLFPAMAADTGSLVRREHQNSRDPNLIQPDGTHV